MALIARITGLSLLTGVLGAALPLLFFKTSDAGVIALCFACVGGIVGGVAGAAREIVTAVRERPAP